MGTHRSVFALHKYGHSFIYCSLVLKLLNNQGSQSTVRIAIPTFVQCNHYANVHTMALAAANPLHLCLPTPTPHPMLCTLKHTVNIVGIKLKVKSYEFCGTWMLCFVSEKGAFDGAKCLCCYICHPGSLVELGFLQGLIIGQISTPPTLKLGSKNNLHSSCSEKNQL